MRPVRFLSYIVLLCVNINDINNEMLIQIQKENLSSMDRCLQTVISKFFSHDSLTTTVVGANDKLDIIRDLNSSVVISTSSHRTKTSFNELHVILYINDEYDDAILKNISRTRMTKFIVVSINAHNVELILESFWELKIVFVVVLVPNGNVIELYKYYPFRNRNCNELWEPVLFNHCENGSLTEKWNDFKLPDIDLMGCTINISFLDIPPFVLRDKTAKEIKHVSGIEGKIFETIIKRLNFTPNYVSRGEQEPGGFNPNSVGVVSDVFTGRSVIGFGAEYPDALRCKNLDHSAVYNFVSTSSFVTPRGAGKQLPKWVTVYYSEFPFMLWMYIILTIMTASVIFRYLNVAVYNITRRKINHSVLVTVSVCFNQPPKTTKIWSIRFFLLFWMYFAFILTSVYQSSMSSLLTAPRLPPEIENIAELLESSLSVKMRRGAIHHFGKSIQGDDSAIIERAILSKAQAATEKLTAMLLNVVRYRNTSYFQRIPTAKYTTALVKELTGKINFVEDVFLFYYPVFFLRKHSYLTEGVNKVIMRLNTAGLIEKWADDLFKNQKVNDVDRVRKVDLYDIYILLIILFGGWTLSIIMFIYELIKFHVTVRSKFVL